jgi:hypothetical protein
MVGALGATKDLVDSAVHCNFRDNLLLKGMGHHDVYIVDMANVPHLDAQAKSLSTVPLLLW